MNKVFIGNDSFGRAIYTEVEVTNWYDDVVKNIDLDNQGDDYES